MSSKQIEYIILAISSFEAEHKGKKRSIGKCAFIQGLVLDVGAYTATIYNLLKLARIIVQDSNLSFKQEISHLAAIGIRATNKAKSSKKCKVDDASVLITQR